MIYWKFGVYVIKTVATILIFNSDLGFGVEAIQIKMAQRRSKMSKKEFDDQFEAFLKEV
jgi:translation elongation factor EF-1beta